MVKLNIIKYDYQVDVSVVKCKIIKIDIIATCNIIFAALKAVFIIYII